MGCLGLCGAGQGGCGVRGWGLSSSLTPVKMHIEKQEDPDLQITCAAVDVHAKLTCCMKKGVVCQEIIPYTVCIISTFITPVQGSVSWKLFTNGNLRWVFPLTREPWKFPMSTFQKRRTLLVCEWPQSSSL